MPSNIKGLPKNAHVYKFGDCAVPSIRRIKNRIPPQILDLIPITMNVVDVNVTVIFRLNLLDK